MPVLQLQQVKLRIALVFFFFFSAAPLASASTQINVNSFGAGYVPPFQIWADSPYKALPTPDATIDLHMKAVCAGAAGCTVPAGYREALRPTMWINPVVMRPEDPDETRYVFFHELGHVFDYVHLDDAERAQIIRMFGFPSTMTWGGTTSARPNELFAEGASNCWYGPNVPARAYGYTYSYEESQPLCRAIRGAYRNDRSWFGQKIAAAKRKFVKVSEKKSTGPAIQWGGYDVEVRYTGGQSRTFYTCSGTARFGKQGSVTYDLCGKSLKTSSTLARPFSIGFWDIPRSTSSTPRR